MHTSVESKVKQEVSPEELSKHRSLLEASNWAQPVQRLISLGGAIFGRNIEENLRNIKDGEPLAIELRRKSAAVVLSKEQYESLLDIKFEFENIVKREGEALLEQSENEFDQLVASMQTKEHGDAMDALFGASSMDLANSFKPGDTESGASDK